MNVVNTSHNMEMTNSATVRQCRCVALAHAGQAHAVIHGEAF
jgi:hypothetical protein